MIARKLTSVFLALLLVAGLLPNMTITANAATDVVNEQNMIELGTEEEYQSSMDSLFLCGYRRIRIYDETNDGINAKSYKEGFVNRNGEFVCPPIYDEIKVYTNAESPTGSKNYNESNATPFYQGYTQCKRNGKMGLLNSKFEEVVPCKYDAVGIPSEGIARVIKNKKLGYYDIEKQKEIVAPKYPLDDSSLDNPAAGAIMNQSDADRGAAYSGKNKGMVKAYYDFNGGYALVPISQTKYFDGEEKNKRAYRKKFAIINRSGKVVTAASSYYSIVDQAYYPQCGPYMTYYQLSKKKCYPCFGRSKTPCKRHGKIWLAGIAGVDKIVVKAKYTFGSTGIAYHGDHGYISAKPVIYPKEKLFFFYNCAVAKKETKKITYLKNDSQYGLMINSSGKIIRNKLPELEPIYYSKYSTFVYNGKLDGIYNKSGKRVGDKKITIYTTDPTNSMGEYNLALATKNGKGKVYICDAKKNKYLKPLSYYGATNVKRFPSKNSPLIIFSYKKENTAYYSIWDYDKDKKIVDGITQINSYLDGENNQKAKFVIYKKGGDYCVMDKDGSTLLTGIKNYSTDSNIARFSEFSKGYLLVTTSDDKMGIFNINTKQYAVAPQSKKLNIYQLATYGIYTVKDSSTQTSYYNIDTGKLIATKNSNDYYSSLSFRGSTITNCCSGYEQTSQYGFIGTDGKYLIPLNYKYTGNNSNNKYLNHLSHTWIVRNGKTYLVNANSLARPTKPKAKGDTAKYAYGTQPGFVEARTTLDPMIEHYTVKDVSEQGKIVNIGGDSCLFKAPSQTSYEIGDKYDFADARLYLLDEYNNITKELTNDLRFFTGAGEVKTGDEITYQYGVIINAKWKNNSTAFATYKLTCTTVIEPEEKDTVTIERGEYKIVKEPTESDNGEVIFVKGTISSYDSVSKNSANYYVVGFEKECCKAKNITTNLYTNAQRVNYIGDSAFEGNGFTKAIIGSLAVGSTLSIGEKAFKDCTSLSEVKLVYLSKLGANAFSGCSKLKEITISKAKLTSANDVKDSLKGSSVETVNVYDASLADYFTEANCGKKVTVVVKK